MVEYSTQNISARLIEELKQALRSVSSYGSVEIYIQEGVVTQITVRNIKKTSRVPLSIKQAVTLREKS